MQVSNPVQFNAIKIGDLLCRLEGQDVQIVGRVVNIATNRRGHRVAVLDRPWFNDGMRSGRIRETTVNRGLTIRKVEG